MRAAEQEKSPTARQLNSITKLCCDTARHRDNLVISREAHLATLLFEAMELEGVVVIEEEPIELPKRIAGSLTIKNKGLKTLLLVEDYGVYYGNEDLSLRRTIAYLFKWAMDSYVFESTSRELEIESRKGEAAVDAMSNHELAIFARTGSGNEVTFADGERMRSYMMLAAAPAQYDLVMPGQESRSLS